MHFSLWYPLIIFVFNLNRYTNPRRLSRKLLLCLFYNWKKWGKEKINDLFKVLKLLFTLWIRAKTVLYCIEGEEMLCLVLIVFFFLFVGSSALESHVTNYIPTIYTSQYAGRKNGVKVYFTPLSKSKNRVYRSLLF